MKRVLTIIVVFLAAISTHELKAGHTAGAEIWYEYAFDPANPNKYKVWVQLYNNVGAIPLANTIQLTYKSSCQGDFCTTMNMVPFNLQPGSDTLPGTATGTIITPHQEECSGTSYGLTQIYRYAVEVNLPGVCADWKFSVNNVYRETNDNLATNSGHVHVEAFLNNTLGPNSNPVFISAGIKNFCTGVPQKWSHAVMEYDSDSVLLSLETPLGSFSCPPTSVTTETWNTGYSKNAPIKSSNGVSFYNGIMEFTPLQQEMDYVKVRVSEYRFDTISLTWYPIGTCERDVRILILANCDTTLRSIDLILEGATDSTLGIIECSDSIITINSSTRIECGSIAPDGSDFALYTSKGTLIPITGAGTNTCLADQNTNAIWLELFQPALNVNDTLLLVTRLGNDGNTLVSSCGHHKNEGDTILIILESCQGSFGINESALPDISLYPNPASDQIKIILPPGLENIMTQIYTITGLPVREQIITSTESEIIVKDLPEGFYAVRVSGNSFTGYVKFQKE